MASMETSRALVCLAASVLLCGAPLCAQSDSTTMQGNNNAATSHIATSAANSADKYFLQSAMEGDMAEIQLAQMAQQKSSNDKVKEFAQKMIDDHTKLDDQVKPIAEQLNVQPPAEPNAKHQAVKTKLESLTGPQFDRQYAMAMVNDHRSVLQEFRKEESAGKDPQVKDAAKQGEPVIAEHLKLAEQLQKDVQSGQ